MTVLHYYNENPSVFQVCAPVLSSIYDAPSVVFRVQLWYLGNAKSAVILVFVG